MRRLLTLLLVSALGLAGCTSGAPSSGSGVAFVGCDQVACSGAIAGAPYRIVMPATWNGTLLLYSHGYRSAQPLPPDFAPVSTSADPAPGWTDGGDGIGQKLLAQGYALAGSAYASNGWAVADGVQAGEQLHDFFAANIATPQRTYVWGESLGGLVTQTIAERDPAWVSGVAPFCGVLAGVVPNFDLGLDVAYAVKVLLAPTFKLTGYTSYQDALTNLELASKQVLAARAHDGATLLAIAALGGAASQTQRFDGATPASRVNAAAEAIITALAFNTAARYDVEQRFGGNISSNTSVDYATRIPAAESATIDKVTAGTIVRVEVALATGVRVSADSAAVAKARAEGGDPLGVVRVPTITVHTAADPLVIVQNESFFAARYAAQRTAGKAPGGLLQLFTVAPRTYAAPAPYGAGHCNFTPATATSVIGLLNTWVTTGTQPTKPAIAAALSAGTGYDPTFQPARWPTPSATNLP